MITASQLAKGLYQAVAERPEDAEHICQRFIQFCKQHHLEGSWPAVVKYLLEQERREQERRLGQATFGLKPRAEALQALKDKFKIERAVEVRVKEDKSLIGGFIARYHDKVYDGSVSGNLKRLRNTLVMSKKYN